MIGELISHYKVISKIGCGGMGEIYKAEDLKLKRIVALKFLPHSFSADNDAKKRLLLEAQSASALDHINICNIHEIGETSDGNLFISMAYYEGETLKDKIKKESLNTEKIIDIFLQICEGLKNAHQKGIIHRDIKPANIFITNDGIVKILDFGLAQSKDISLSSLSSYTGGTVSYMSPEQITGSHIDQQTDIWSLGVILYEMLTGELPFKGEYDQAVIYSILNAGAEITDFKKSHTKLVLKKLIEKCLAKERSLRFKSVNEIIDLLKPTKQYKKHLFETRKSLILSIIITAGIISLFIIKNFQNDVSVTEDKYRIGVLLFRYNQVNNDRQNFSDILQFLIANKLNSIKELSVVDPLSLNNLIENSSINAGIQILKINEILRDISVSYYIDGKIIPSKDGYIIYSHLIEPDRNIILVSKSARAKNEDDLPAAADELVSEFINYFHISLIPISKDRDVNPLFTQGTNNMAALKAFLLAGQFNYKGNKADEMRYLLKAIELDSNFISPRVWLTSTLIFTGKTDEAVIQLKILEKLKANASPFENVMIDWTNALISNDIDNQIHYLKIALDYSPQNNIILFCLARLYFIRKDYSKTLELLKNTIQMKWQYSSAYYLAGISCCFLNNYKEAKNILESSLEIDPDPEIYGLLSVIYGKENNFFKEKEHLADFYNTSLKEGQSLAESNFVIADMNFELERINNSIPFYRNSVLHAPDNYYYHLAFANALCNNNDTSSAIFEYLTVLKLNPNDLEATLTLGMIYDKQNDTINAVKYYNNYLRVNPLDSISLYLKERLQLLIN